MKHYFLFLASILTVMSCSKSDSSDPTPKSTVAYQGTVNLVDEFGANQVDRSLVSVTVTDTSPNWVARTDASGAYTLPLSSVPAGTHQLRYSFSGYGTYLKADVATGTQLPAVTLGKLSTTHITLVAAKSGANYVIQGTVIERPTAAQPRPYRLFLTRSFAPAPPLPVASAYYLSLAGSPAADGTFSLTLTPSDLTAAGFRTGDDVLVFAAGDNPMVSTYPDPTSGKTVYPAANFSINTIASFSFR